MTCPHCHRPMPKPKLVTSTPAKSDMTDAQLYAHYKQTAPLADLAFWLRTAELSPTLRAGFDALGVVATNTTIPRPAFYRQLTALQDLWRQESNARERQEHLDAGQILISGFWTDREEVTEVPAVFADSAVA